MLVAGVEEKFSVVGLIDEREGGVEVALAGEDRVGVHPVHLRWHPGGPGGAERGHRDARIEQQRAPRSWPRLRQVLGGEHAEGEAGVHQPGGQSLDRPRPALDHLAGEADLERVSHPLVDSAEGAALEQVGRVHGVPGPAQLVGEGDDAGGQPQRVVEERNLSHLESPSAGCYHLNFSISRD